MKNILKLSVAAVFAAFLTVGLSACGGGSPSDVAVKATKLMYDGKGEKVLSLVDLSDAPDGTDSMVEGKLKSQAAAMKKMAEQAGGVAKVEVVEESVDGDKASVRVKVSFKQMGEKTEKFRLSKVKGDWKIQL